MKQPDETAQIKQLDETAHPLVLSFSSTSVEHVAIPACPPGACRVPFPPTSLPNLRYFARIYASISTRLHGTCSTLSFPCLHTPCSPTCPTVHIIFRYLQFPLPAYIHPALLLALLCISYIIIIIKGHSLRRACLQPATNTQNSKPRPPTTNTKSKGKTTK